jgi:CelD/BcsL family acetyltransferase involved in cellulose biosynthesis
MHIEVITGRDIDETLWSTWEAIQASAPPELHNPFFHPGYVTAIGSIRDDVRIGVIEDGGRVVGFFPFELGRWNVARPAGLRLNDYQGVVINNDTEWDPIELMAGCGIAAWDFDHLITVQDQFRSYWGEIEESPIIELEGGFEAYEARRRELGIKQYRDTMRRSRKLSRDVGEYRVEILHGREDILRQMMDWKSKQCALTGTVDYFALGWPARLIETIAGMERGEFSALHSALFVGDRLLASQFYMRSFGVWHFWVMSSDAEFHRYSPGMVLLLEMIKHAAESGAKWIDFGKGMHLFKRHFMTGSISVAAGHVERPSIITSARRLTRASESWARNSALYPLIRLPGRIIKNRQRQKRYE